MFKSIAASGLLVLALACAPALAQTAPPPDQAPPADQSAPTGAAPPAGAPATAKPSAKELVAGCRDEAKGKGLKGDAFKASVHDCVAAQRPKLADRMQCRQQGKAQGLADDALKAFVKDCVAQAKQ